jgi:hypothetical protein
VIGCGSVGLHVIRMGRAFGMDVVAYDVLQMKRGRPSLRWCSSSGWPSSRMTDMSSRPSVSDTRLLGPVNDLVDIPTERPAVLGWDAREQSLQVLAVDKPTTNRRRCRRCMIRYA